MSSDANWRWYNGLWSNASVISFSCLVGQFSTPRSPRSPRSPKSRASGEWRPETRSPESRHAKAQIRSFYAFYFLYAFFAYSTSPLPYIYHQSPECPRKWTPIVRTRTPSTTPSGGDNTVCSGQGGACIMMSAGGCPITGATLPMR